MKREDIRKKFFSLIRGMARVVVYGFAAIGFCFVAMFFAIRWHLTDTSGKEDVVLNAALSARTQKNAEMARVLGVESAKGFSFSSVNAKFLEAASAKRTWIAQHCFIRVLGEVSSVSARAILLAEEKTKNPIIVGKMIQAARLQFPDTSDMDEKVARCEGDESGYESLASESFPESEGNAETPSIFAWANDLEWKTIRAGIIKDKDSILRAAATVDIEPRMLLTGLVGEQIRLLHSQRELVKQVFAPLQILGNANKISLGVMGIKEATAQSTESHLKDPSSEFYLGEAYQNVLDDTSGQSLYDRLTSESDHHYWSYAYGAAYMKQMLVQWKNAGYDMQYRPEIVGTLYNVGFSQSRPKPDPKVGGSTVHVGDREYTFGRLGYEFYYSGELLDDFPYRAES